MVFLFPQPSEKELEPYYDEAYYGPERKKFWNWIERCIVTVSSAKWNRLRPLLRPGDRVLDVGCGRGTMLRLARQSGYQAAGVERHAPVGHSVPGVLYHSLPQCDFPDHHFQLVILWHVLEHLPEPAPALQEIYRILQPGGWLSVAVPNYGGAQAKASGPDWFHLDLPRHLSHFGPASLEKLLTRQGFQVSRRATLSLEYDWFGTLQSWMNRAFADQNRLYALLQGKAASSRGAEVGRLLGASLLALPALGSALWNAARGSGGTLNFLAQKPSEPQR